MAIDHETWLNQGSEDDADPEICVICDIDFDSCEHTIEEIKESEDQDEAQSRYDDQQEKYNEEDLNGEVDW